MSYLSWKKIGWPVERVIGSGTLLDSGRFRYLIGEKLKIDPRSVHAHIVGEHGDSELPLWSLANVAGTELKLSETEKEEIYTNTRDAAYQIIQAKVRPTMRLHWRLTGFVPQFFVMRAPY